jgi:cobalt-zinc-cadmium resistance protein CzcA
MELRTIQDWIVKRQMALIPGVVEVNSFGGNIKQYEIALNPDKLNAMSVSITEVFEALENNNVNTGGAYIEKGHMANFIRGEGLARSLDDIKNIVVKNENGIPILIKDVAENVHFGSQVRYGAFTQEGHEAVGGMILMLKGENSNEVIQSVKARIAEVQKTLPKGLEIAPFLDRSDLIQRTTSTVSRNLMEGALIVIFVLVILLGSLRGGLVTASVIPLSLLFAFVLMKVFDVWANLMSLGAIDFGIIVDGAVIIVEGTVHEIEKRVKAGKGNFSRAEMDELTYHASSTMMNSAFFGQLIILIVFAPILFLTGVEGKMFQPMAFTFGFAVLGAILLCLTYVPMISSIVMKPTKNKNSWFARFENLLEKISAKILNRIHAAYNPILRIALKRKIITLAIAIAILGSAVFVFTRMGGEFIPSLNEGDIAMQAFLRPGSSLSETIEREKEIEEIIMANFPEVKTVCARIGVADIPTDPMGFDYTDSFIILEKDISKWVSATTKEELIEKIREKVAHLPGLNFTFSQPVELRFNELLTGVREDVAVKLFGEDMDVLAEKGEKMEEIINTVPGAEDVTLERTAGLPQMTVQYDRGKIAQYGLDISKLNRYVSAAFAGSSAGVIFEGERRFDMVIRLDKEHRKSIEDLRNLYVDLPNGKQVPIKEVAEINYQPGAMQISRESTFRRIYVGVNVRGRDVESVVNEIQQKLDKQLELPAGYYITYGGEFENLQRAKNRLSIVLPIALVLIFILLYFALQSFPQTVMIYMAVPLAAIGGIYSLWLRGMPFSISAGVGFIVLFGVAVLNGLVLISRFNSLKTEGIIDIMDRIYIGTQERLRPILLTATAAMLGFLPMAISESAGAEVQRPLATVVIGGLFSATFLTLVVVPVLYALVESFTQKRKQRRLKISGTPIIILLFLSVGLSLISLETQAQEKDSLPQITIKEAVSRAKNNFPLIKAAQLEVQNQEALKRTAWDIGNTEFLTGAEELGNSNDGIYTNLSVRQEFDVLSIGAKSRVQNKQVAISRAALDLSQLEVEREVSIAWGEVYSAKSRYRLYLQLDSVFRDFERAARLRFETEATSRLEYLSASNQAKQIIIQKEKSKMDYQIALQKLNLWLVSDTIFSVDEASINESGALLYLPLDSIYQHPELQLSEQKVQLADARVKLAKSGYLPKFTAEYGSQKIGSQTGYYKYQFGMSIPLVFASQSGKAQSAKIESSIARENFYQKELEINTAYMTLYEEYQKWLTTSEYYRTVALPVAKEQKQGAITAYREGAIDYVTFLQNMKDAMQIEFDYWDANANYLDSRFKVEYFINASK